MYVPMYGNISNYQFYDRKHPIKHANRYWKLFALNHFSLCFFLSSVSGWKEIRIMKLPFYMFTIFLTVFAVLIVSLLLIFVLAVFDHQFVF